MAWQWLLSTAFVRGQGFLAGILINRILRGTLTFRELPTYGFRGKQGALYWGLLLLGGFEVLPPRTLTGALHRSSIRSSNSYSPNIEP